MDGRKAETFKTDLALRGVLLPGGQRTLEFRFESKSLRNGIIVSLVVAALLVLYLGAMIVKRYAFKSHRERREAVGDNPRT